VTATFHPHTCETCKGRCFDYIVLDGKSLCVRCLAERIEKLSTALKAAITRFAEAASEAADLDRRLQIRESLLREIQLQPEFRHLQALTQKRVLTIMGEP